MMISSTSRYSLPGPPVTRGILGCDISPFIFVESKIYTCLMCWAMMNKDQWSLQN
ncbi:hypothetical protein HanRHA438_Chr03g0123151 [Helianthus annuus]|nr:hypothetical protein HanRHA438_Chr03g0123151 [Helianthus annuus]